MEQNNKTTHEIKGVIHSVESFGSVDGPGVRYIIFLQGCRMRCRYCHNPDTWAMHDKSSYEETPEETLKKALRYRNYWKQTGGITVSGGEALLQIDYVTELFRLAKKQGVHTTLDTSGNPFTREEPFFSKFNELMKYTDLFMLDIKQINNEKHEALTHCSNHNILNLAEYLSENNKDMWIRHVLVPGYTDDEQDLRRLGDFVRTLQSVKRFEILPYHTLGVFKWEELGVDYSLKEVIPPTKEQIEKAQNIMNTESYKGYLTE